MTKQYYIDSSATSMVENLAESAFTNDVPRQMLEILIGRVTRRHLQATLDLETFDAYYNQAQRCKRTGFYATLLNQIQAHGDQTASRVWMVAQRESLATYVDMLKLDRRTAVVRESRRERFKPSKAKGNFALRMFPTNCHVHNLYIAHHASSNMPDVQASEQAVYETVTVGAAAAHCRGFKKGGLTRLDAALAKRREGRRQWNVRTLIDSGQLPDWTEDEQAIEEAEWELDTRLNICFPQAVTTLVTALARKMNIALRDPLHGPAMLDQLVHLVALTEMVERNRAGRKKHPEILQLSSDLTRLMDAGRVTCCKSAKDRSSMSITLEHGRLLVTNHRLPPLLMPEVVSTMRSAGVRLDNTFKNTGKRKFAFNALQRSLLPEAYRCPPQAGGNNKS